MKEIKVSNLENCFLITSNEDYSKLRKYKWRYIRGGSFLTNYKRGSYWTSTTIGRVLGNSFNNFYLYKDGDILNISRSNRVLLQKIKKEDRPKLRELRKISIDKLDKILNERIRRTEYRGVQENNYYYREKTGNDIKKSFSVVIYKNRKYHYFGTYEDKKVAAGVYNEHAKRLFGEKVKLNFV